MLLAYTMARKVGPCRKGTIASATREGLKVHARAELLTENAWTPPTLVGTRLYIRDRKNVMAVELGE